MALLATDDETTGRMGQAGWNVRTTPAPLGFGTGMPPTLLLRVHGGRDVLIDRPVFSIGRAPGNDLRLDDARVSSFHCEIVLGSRGPFLRDLGSTNGTRVGGTRVQTAYLEPGMLVTVGRVATIRVLAFDAKTIDDCTGLIGASHCMVSLRQQVALVGATERRVLILGENGTGKEIVANQIHRFSRRRQKPIVTANCGAIARELAESALFGHVRGAFTGATGPKDGLLLQADGGTLFLDEIGDLPIEMQVKLLRALEQGTFRPVGADTERRVNVRVIAATNRDLPAMVSAGAFREDLYHRLMQMEIRTPALREHKEDIPLLASQFLDGVADDCGYKSVGLLAGTLLQMYNWPGNVRELRNVIEAAAAVAGDVVEPQDFPARLQRSSAPRPRMVVDRDYIKAKLDEAGGNRTHAARLAGMKKATFCRWVLRYGLVSRAG